MMQTKITIEISEHELVSIIELLRAIDRSKLNHLQRSAIVKLRRSLKLQSHAQYNENKTITS